MASTTLPTNPVAGAAFGVSREASGVEEHGAGQSGRSLIFRAGGRVYCCDVEAVHEVVSLGVITRLPGAPAYVPGIINVRGVIITVVDAGLYLHGRPSETPGSVMLVHAGVRPVGLLVDAVSDVRTVRAEEGYHTLDVRAAVARVIVITEDE